MIKLFSSIFWPFLTCFITFLFFLPNLINGRVPIPADSLLGLYHPWRDVQIENYQPGKFPTKNPLITDPVLQTYPWRKLSIENFKDFSFPLWNPYSFSGQPLLGNVQSAPFQIFNIFFFIFPFKVAWIVQIIIPVVLSSLFMYLFLKSLQIKDFAAAYGGFILPFSGFYIAWQTWGTIVTTAMWLPAILLCINQIYKKNNVFWYMFLIIAFTQTIFSGHWQTAFYVFFATGLYFGYKQIIIKNYKVFCLIILSIIISILICSPQIIPSLEFIKNSARELDQSYYPGRKDWFLPAQNMIQLIAPDFFGNPATYNYWGVWNYAEFVSYNGIIPLMFALYAIINKLKKTLIFVLFGTLSLFFALENPISKIPYLFHLPLFDSLQPSRIIFLLDFSLVTLSAIGLEKFSTSKKNFTSFIPFALLIIIFTSLFIFVKTMGNILPVVEKIDSKNVAFNNLIFPTGITLLFMIPYLISFKKSYRNIAIILIFMLTIFETFRFGNKFISFSKISWIFPETKITAYLEKQQKPFRVLATDRRLINGNSSAVYRIETVQGYDPIYLKEYAQFVSSWESGKPEIAGSFNRIITPQKYDSNITNLMNVQYILSFDEINKQGFSKILTEGDTKLYKNKNALPRAFFADQIINVKNKNEELERILNENNSLKTAYSSQTEFPKSTNNGDVKIVSYQDQAFYLQTTTDRQLPLIVSNINYPGWKAYIDGQKTSIIGVNYLLQSIIVPQGVHKISFKFQPDLFYNSFYISGFGLLLAIISSAIIWKKKLV